MSPCPFCGAIPSDRAADLVNVADADGDGFSVGCQQCGAIGPTGATHADAGRLWNASRIITPKATKPA